MGFLRPNLNRRPKYLQRSVARQHEHGYSFSESNRRWHRWFFTKSKSTTNFYLGSWEWILDGWECVYGCQHTAEEFYDVRIGMSAITVRPAVERRLGGEYDTTKMCA
jgi:hypothetical protein